jgi:hypothetical protein
MNPFDPVTHPEEHAAWERLPDETATKPTGDDKEPKKSASTLLVELAEERFDFGVTDLGETFGVPRVGPRLVHMARGGKVSMRKQLARIYFARIGKAAPQQALADAMLVIEGMAQETEPTELALRVAKAHGAVWIDMGDTTGRAIRVGTDGWSIVDEPPVLFRRTELTGALPEPEPGDLAELWEWINVDEPDRPIVLAWLLAALLPDLPHPVLNLSGEQGTGKTTTEKVLVSLIDPTPVPTRKAPATRTPGSPPRPDHGWSGWTTCPRSPTGSATPCAGPSPATGRYGASSTPTESLPCSRSGA